MRAAGNNSLPQQPRSGGRLTLQRLKSASPRQGAQDFRGPLLPPPPAPRHPVCHPTLQSLLLPHLACEPPLPLSLAGPVSTTSQQHTTLPHGCPSHPLSSKVWNPVSKAGMLKPFA